MKQLGSQDSLSPWFLSHLLLSRSFQLVLLPLFSRFHLCMSIRMDPGRGTGHPQQQGQVTTTAPMVFWTFCFHYGLCISQRKQERKETKQPSTARERATCIRLSIDASLGSLASTVSPRVRRAPRVWLRLPGSSCHQRWLFGVSDNMTSLTFPTPLGTQWGLGAHFL